MMKKITLLVLSCIVSTATMAHDVPVPHAHSGYIHGLVPFMQYVMLPLLLVIGVVKVYGYFKKAKEA